MHLYLMQNCHGLLKIGQSNSPSARRARLEQLFRCEVALLKVLENRGYEEETFHRELWRFRVIGEWFSGTHRAREVIGPLFKLRRSFDWPFVLDKDAARAWVSSASHVYADRSRDGKRRKVIARLRRALLKPNLNDNDCATLDGQMACALDYEIGQRGYRVVLGQDGRHQAINPYDEADRIPRYTTDTTAVAELLEPHQRIVTLPSDASYQRTVAYCIESLLRFWGFGGRPQNGGSNVR